MSIVKVFGDIDMRLGITGLGKYLQENKVRLTNNDMAMFLNRKKTHVKIMWSNEFCLHFRKESGQISIDELKLIPKYFTGVFINHQMEVRIGQALNLSPIQKDKAA